MVSAGNKGIITGLCVAVFCSLVLIVSSDWRLIYRITFFAFLVGFTFFLTFPNPRLTLTGVWFLIFPLSIEKTFPVGKPLDESFINPMLVISAADFILISLFVWIYVESFIKKQPIGKLSLIFKLIGLYLLYSFLLGIFTGFTIGSLLNFIQNIKIFLTVFCLSLAVRTREEMCSILVIIGISVLIQSCFTIFSYASGRPFSLSSLSMDMSLLTFESNSGVSHVRASGTVGHSNQQAIYHVFFTFPLAGLLMLKNRKYRFLTMFTIALSLFALMITFSRSAWLATFIGVLSIFIIGTKRKMIHRRSFRIMYIASPLIIIIISIFSGQIYSRIIHGDEGATASRVRLMKSTFELIQKNMPMGVGPGNFIEASMVLYPIGYQYNRWISQGEHVAYGSANGLEYTEVHMGDEHYIIPLEVHNKYLLILTELGITGILIFCIWQISLLKIINKVLDSSDRVIKHTALGLMGSFWASQIFMMLDLIKDDKTNQILVFISVFVIILQKIKTQKMVL